MPLLTVFLAAQACAEVSYARTGTVRTAKLDEMSGLQASRSHPGVLWTHNDDGDAVLYAIDARGDLLGHVLVTGAINLDWEDLALVPGEVSDLLVVGDFGESRPAGVEPVLYLVEEPVPARPGHFEGEIPFTARLPLRFPAGAEDIESMAWDPLAERLLLLAKRSRPARLYALDLQAALDLGVAELVPVGVVSVLRPPQPADQKKFGKRTPWISQPTGLDISPDGGRAALITYRSLYLFRNDSRRDWALVLDEAPVEIIGPPATHEEAVAFLPDGRSLLVTSEGKKAPIYTYRID